MSKVNVKIMGIFIVIALVISNLVGCGVLEESNQSKVIEKGNLTVHFIDVGQADSTLIEVDDENGEYTVLIDTGDIFKTDSVDYLNEVGVEDIDVLVGTHPHADHIGQFVDILQGFNVGEVWMSGDESSSNIFQELVIEIDRQDIGYEEPRMGDTYEVGSLEFSIVNPESINGDLNNGSVAFRMDYGDVSFMFTGDAESSAEKNIINSGVNLESDILHMGHHGSDTSSTDEFLAEVKPDVAIYSAGVDNKYNHPGKDAISRVEGIGADVYGTAVDGTIVLTSNGKEYNITTDQSGEKDYDVGNKKEQLNKDEDSEVSQEVSNTGNNELNDCIDINKADESELVNIKHVGEKTAEKIKENRPYETLNDLKKVNGIGDSKVTDIIGEGAACVK